MNAVIRMHASSLRVTAVTPKRGGRGTPPEPAATLRRTTLSIDGRRFLLSISLDTEELEKRLVDAVRNRGDMVSFTVAGEREVCVLVSPGVAVILEHEDVAVEDPDTEDAPILYDDVEYLT
ncbi:hypothetical protein C5C31_07230 [Rathayibacter rathayi]|uniref:Uncharacterized protein n=1 Tax=Rathayibacter rathayi TaxID=33887 RepID=A0ABD6W5B4_RATRA|nr:hypothetical protein [Rathayibacter rathayi]AZZ49659.1 hypothetical protein C1O28_11080 [Rathayibacter rathayi]MWV75323.1 hypothetical protein [Rathayibacter rathayi NCPPB 2980 = VKM Ac-1601]PPF09641.1 hypothetical protein C5C04_14535 [Rathayibacter rathayi]PPF42780.1 hypothetical protein C5C08_14660 [Rathayibacter rathayi]PPF75307.1 hypothetical protein C5C14_14455 [Rathayibacter rathayi]